MPFHTRCTRCDAQLAFEEPLPHPDAEIACLSCGRPITVRYPQALLDRIGTRRFAQTPAEIVVSLSKPGRVLPIEPPTLASSDPDAPTRMAHAASTVVQSDAPNPPLLTRRRPSSASASPPRPPPPDPTSGKRQWLRRLLALFAVALVLAGASGWAVVAYYERDLPDLEALTNWHPAGVTRVLDRHGELLGEIYEERRYVLDYDAIPKQVRDAFVASEDSSFWEHGGLDYFGIVRAMLRNLIAGRVTQGGSTITQQVAKSFLLTRDRTFARKIKEAILARRIDATLTKEQVLGLYLNSIFLGSQSYGVEAAARTFFGKHVDELSTGEIAMLAGLPPRPSSWNPHASYTDARNRERVVLDRMVSSGLLTATEADAAFAQEPQILPPSNRFRELAPWCTEQARRTLINDLGFSAEDIVNGGLEIHTTCDLSLQNQALSAVRKGVIAQDHHMGYRRVDLSKLPDEPAITAWRTQQDRERRQALDLEDRAPLPPPQVGERVRAVVLEADTRWLRVAIGTREGLVPLSLSKWVYPVNPARNWKYRVQDSLIARIDTDGDGKPDRAMFEHGDVVWVQVEGLNTTAFSDAKAFSNTPGAEHSLLALSLWQDPEVEGTLLSFDVATGAIRAMIGGYDFNQSQLNRTLQARRQVGSTFKPFIYGSAIASRKMTAASIVADAPIALGSGEELWKPDNYGSDFKGNLTLRQALALSRNTCTVRVLDAIDPNMNRDVVHDFARRLGIGLADNATAPDTSRPTPDNDHLCLWLSQEEVPARSCIDPTQTSAGKSVCRACDMSIALGSASLSIFEMARAYGIFATGGTWVQPYLVEQVRSAKGETLYTHKAPEPVQVIEPEVASIVTWLLQNVVEHGTGAEAHAALGGSLAGKTGTTNEEKDAWFVGFSPDVVTAVWVGFDQPRPMGSGTTGGQTALPIWIDYMREALKGYKKRPFEVRGRVHWAKINESTGLRVESGGLSFPFISDTLPELSPYAEGQASLQDLMSEL